MYVNSQAGNTVHRLATIESRSGSKWAKEYVRLTAGTFKIQIGVTNDKGGDFFLRQVAIGNISLCEEKNVYSSEYIYGVVVTVMK